MIKYGYEIQYPFGKVVLCKNKKETLKEVSLTLYPWASVYKISNGKLKLHGFFIDFTKNKICNYGFF